MIGGDAAELLMNGCMAARYGMQRERDKNNKDTDAHRINLYNFTTCRPRLSTATAKVRACTPAHASRCSSNAAISAKRSLAKAISVEPAPLMATPSKPGCAPV